MVEFLLEFRRKIIDFSVFFDAITFGVSILSWLKFRSDLDEKSSTFGVLFDALTFGVSIFSWLNFGDCRISECGYAFQSR